MSVTFTMTWASGQNSQTTGGFILTTDKGIEEVVTYDSGTTANIKNPVHRAVADELANQSGSATGTVTVTIA